MRAPPALTSAALLTAALASVACDGSRDTASATALPSAPEQAAPVPEAAGQTAPTPEAAGQLAPVPESGPAR